MRGSRTSGSNACSRPPAPPRVPRSLLCLAGLAAVWGLVARWQYFWDIPRYSAGLYGTIARNHLKYGYPDAGLAQIVTPGPPVPRQEWCFYANHPPLVPLIGSVSVAVAGPSAVALRLPHLACGLVLLVLLAVWTGRLFGPMAGAWAAIFAAALPVGIRYGGSLPSVMGPMLVLWMCAAVCLYARHAETGRRVPLALLVGAMGLALLTAWPAYVLAFVLAAHALGWRSRARRGAVLVLPAVAGLLFGGLWLYQRSIPVGRTPWGGMGVSFAARLLRPSADGTLGAVAAAWLADFVGKLLMLCSPLLLVAVPWLAAWAWGAIRRRACRPEHHVLVLWASGLGFAAAVPRIFEAHVHYHLLFYPAAVVSLGAVFARLDGWARVRRPRATTLAAVLVCLFLLAWSRETLAALEHRTPEDYQQAQVAWARDLLRHTRADERVAFPAEHTWQMRFLADRALVDRVDSAAALRALRTERAAVPRLYVPLGVPFADAGYGEELAAWTVDRAAEAGAFFAWRSGAERSVPLRRLSGVALEGGVRVEELSLAVLGRGDGPRLLYLGIALATPPGGGSFSSLAWSVRFLDGAGGSVGRATLRAKPSSSYLVAVPAAWPADTGRVALELERRRTDAASVGRWGRAARLALRVASFGRLGQHRVRTEVLRRRGGSPIVLSAAPGQQEEGG